MDEPAAPVHTVADLVTRAAERAGDRPALLSGPATLTWAELDELVDRAAGALRGLGLAPGDRVVLQLGNSVDFPALYFGALRAGLVAVPANTGYTGPELTHLLQDSGARALVTSSVHVIAEAAALRTGELRHVLVAAPSGPDGTLPLPGLLADAPELAYRHVPRSPEDLAVLGYTSGTSGRPRGAMLTHRALLANLEQCAALWPTPVLPSDVVLLAIPLFHAYGLNPGLGLLARAGATGVLVDHFDPAGTLELIARHRVTAVPAVPAMYVRWAAEPGLRAAFAGVRLATSGAAPLPPATLLALGAAGISVYEGYGLTEAAPVLTSTLVGGAPKPGSVGRAIPGVELRLAEASRRGDRAGAGGRGGAGRARPGRPGRRSGRDRGPRAEPVLRLLAGRRGRAGRRGLVGDRRRGVRGRRRRPAPGRPAYGADPGQRVQRLPGRGRGGARPRIPGWPRPRWSAGPTRSAATRPCWPTWSRRPGRRRPSRSCWTGRRGRWPGSSCRRRWSSCRSCRTPPPAR